MKISENLTDNVKMLKTQLLKFSLSYLYSFESYSRKMAGGPGATPSRRARVKICQEKSLGNEIF